MSTVTLLPKDGCKCQQTEAVTNSRFHFSHAVTGRDKYVPIITMLLPKPPEHNIELRQLFHIK